MGRSSHTFMLSESRLGIEDTAAFGPASYDILPLLMFPHCNIVASSHANEPVCIGIFISSISEQNADDMTAGISGSVGPPLDEPSDVRVTFQRSKKRPLYSIFPQNDPELLRVRQYVVVICLRREVLV